MYLLHEMLNINLIVTKVANLFGSPVSQVCVCTFELVK